MDSEEYKFLLGKVDAIGMLCATIGEMAWPAGADLVLRRIAALRAEVALDKPMGSYQTGYCSFEELILSARETIEAAKRLRSDPGGKGN